VRNVRVPGYLGIPKTGSPPYPCVLQIHGLTGMKSGWWMDDFFTWGGLITKELISAGYAVLALDAEYHGERMANNDYESVGDMVYRRGWYNTFCQSLIQSTVDYRRALDYLATRAEIDSSRTGIIGSSMGGMMTFILTAVEPRIKVSAASVTWTIDIEDVIIRKGYTASYIAPYNFAGRTGQRPFLMMMGRSDRLYTNEEAEQLYKLIDGPVKNLIFYDSGHRLPKEYGSDAVRWFQKHL